MVIQPVLGFLHHRQYLKTQQRGAISIAHQAYGTILMAFGIINGGLGLQLASADDGFKIAYGVIAAVMFVIYLAVKLFRVCATRRQARRGSGARVEKVGSGGRRDKYNQAPGEEVEMPRR